MKQRKLVAVITPNVKTFFEFIYNKNTRFNEYVQISNFDDARGRSFNSYELLYDAYKIHNVHNIVSFINSRLNIKEKSFWQKFKQKIRL